MQRDATRCAKAIGQVLSEDRVGRIAEETGFGRRRRKLTPLRAVWLFVVGLGSGTANTLADLVRLFSDLSGVTIEYKPFHDRLSKDGFPKFFRRVCEELMSGLVGPVLVSRKGRLARFKDVWIQDGTSFALNDRLKRWFRGRFTKISPAAVEVHCTYSLFQGQAVRLAVAPDCQGERDFLPTPSELKDKLLLVDRGYVSYDYFASVNEAGGFYIARAKDKNLNPRIVRCLSGLPAPAAARGLMLRDILLPNRTVDLIVSATGKSGKTEVRLVILYVASKKKRVFLLTNLPTAEFPASVVATTYRLRWQIELLFKECKSYTQLQKFQTADPHIAEGLIWASLAALLFRRFLTFSAHEFRGSRSATLVAATSSWIFLRDLGRAAIRRCRRFRDVIDETLALLRNIAGRSNLQRTTPFEDLGLVAAGNARS